MTTTRIQEHEVRACPTHEIPGLPGWHHCASAVVPQADTAK